MIDNNLTLITFNNIMTIIRYDLQPGEVRPVGGKFSEILKSFKIVFNILVGFLVKILFL